MARILIVDDEISLRKMLRLTLTRFGYDTQEARDGNEALAVLREAPADVVLTDLIMPEREGIETIEAIRHEFPAIKIIAMSGGGRMTYHYLEIARCMGAHRTLTKPFSNDELTAALAAVLVAAPVDLLLPHGQSCAPKSTQELPRHAERMARESARVAP